MKYFMSVSIIFIALLQFNIAKAQSSNDGVLHKQFQSIIPQSPNAAALGKFGELPVGVYTGIPSISIPVYEINSGRLKLPVSLSYHAGGIKVEEIASWAGLGWSLSAGGQVTRQVRGVPDEGPHGYLSEFHSVYNYEQITDIYDKQDYLRSVLHDGFDSEPDVFSYSAGGISGEFFYDTTGNFITRPLSKVRIDGPNGYIITDNDGTTYYFETPEFTTSTTLSNNAAGGESSGVSAWLLSKIVSVTGADTIKFEYESNVTNFTTFSSQTKYQWYYGSAPQCSNKPPVTYTSANTVTGYRLKKIIFNSGEIVFNKKTDMRLDVPDDNALESIVVHSNNNAYYKKYVLYQHYAASSGAPSQYNQGYKEYYRLILDSIEVQDNVPNTVQHYKFEYENPEHLPNRTSFSQDYWGYFNNGNNTSDFVPSSFVWTPNSSIMPAYIPGADRNPKEGFAKKGMLTKIIYPTGGNTTFEYEGNRALTLKQIGGSSESNGNVSLGSNLTGPTVFTSAPFTIPNCGYNANYASVDVVLNNSNCGNGAQSLECPLVNIINQNTSATFPVTASGVYLLPVNETYYVQADLSGVTNQNVFNNFYVTLNWINCTQEQVPGASYTGFNSPVGGLRVKSVTTYDPVGQVTESKSYDYNWPGTSIPSGFVTCLPEFIGDVEEGSQAYTCAYKTISSTSNYPLLSTHGSTVGYSFVRESFGTGGANGIKEYRYSSPGDAGDYVNPNFPFPPTMSNEWQRGYPLYERTLKAQTVNNQLTFTPVSRKIFKYDIPVTVQSRKGLKVGVKFNDLSGSSGTLEVDTALMYNVEAGLLVPAGDTTILYSSLSSNDSLITITTSSYSVNSFLPNDTKTKVNSNKTITEKVIYNSDYPQTPSSTDPVTIGIRNITTAGTPVETFTVIKNAANQEFVTSGMLTTYLPDKPLPDKIYVLKTAAPIPLASFVQAYINTSGVFVKDSRYEEEVSFDGYDSYANLKGQRKSGNVVLSYLYDYGNKYPVAQAVNSQQADIAFTSFEADGTGNFTIVGTAATDATAPTGKKSYPLSSGNITKAIDAGKTYIVSLWKTGTVNITNSTLYRTGRTINGWTYVEYQVSSASSITISGSVSIDELRLYPKNAQMTSYTYEPLVGMTTQSDANGNILYYEYDGLGRLKYIKDMDKNIVKVMEYKYKVGVGE